MDNIEKEFKKEAYILMNSKVFEGFKNGFPSIYEATINTLRSINNSHINNNSLTLIKPKIKKLSLKNGSEKVFLLCGCFMLRGKKVLLLELSETIGTYFIEDTNLVNKLTNYKIGTKLRLIRVNDNYELVLPYDKVEGLFQ